MTDELAVYHAWEAEARKLFYDGWKRREYPNPNVQTTFHKGGQAVILIPDGNGGWQPEPLDLKEPMTF